ncbi:MAG: YceD family protein [Pseudomonadaceae bacterium]|nr:YceD family protein [Pseudomonadaceae bacterium]
MSASVGDQNLEFRALARREADLEIRVAAAALSRLADAAQLGSPAHVEASFRMDEHGQCRVRGTVSIELALECQRCLEPVAQVIEASLDAVIVDTEAAAIQVGKRSDVIMADAGELLASELIEDELLLALPVDRCGDDQCPRMPPLVYVDPAAAEPLTADEESESPFSVLAQLKSDTDDSPGA